MAHNFTQRERVLANNQCREKFNVIVQELNANDLDALHTLAIDLQCEVNLLRARLEGHTMQPRQCMCFPSDSDKCTYCLDVGALEATKPPEVL